LDYLGGDDCILEREPLETLAREGQLVAFHHTGFFQAMDTYREYKQLNDLWASGAAPWKDRVLNPQGSEATEQLLRLKNSLQEASTETPTLVR
jgi:NDP-sugar pyrophosphorylase family protein